MIDGCDRADLRAGAAIEGLIGEIQFGPVDFPLLHFYLDLIADDPHDRTPRNSFQYVRRDGRRRQNAVAEHEEIRGRSFRNVAVGIQNDRFVKAGPYGVGLDESRVDICARDLAARRKTVIVDAAPGGNRHVHILFVLVVGAEWHDHNRNYRWKAVKANADDFVRIECKRANVEIFLVSFGANQLDQPLQQIVAVCLRFHTKQLRGLKEPAKVITGSENEELLLILVPVSAEAPKYGGFVSHKRWGRAQMYLRKKEGLSGYVEEILKMCT